MHDDLPRGWTWTTVGAIGDWVGGGTPSKSNASYWTQGTIPWVSPKDMKRPVIDDAEDHITAVAIDESSTQLVPNGSVLVVTRSGILQHTLPVAVTARAVAINQDLKALIPSPVVLPQYVAAFLRAHQQDILRRCSKAGTTVASIAFESLKCYAIPLPPLAEQRRIVAKLDALLASSRAARSAIIAVPALTTQLITSVMELALQGKLTDDWRALHRDCQPAGEALDQFADAVGKTERRRVRLWGSGRSSTTAAHLPVLPRSWVWAQVGQLGTPGDVVQIGPMSMKSSEFLDSGHMVLNVGCVRDGWIDTHKADYLPSERALDFRRYMLRTDDIVFTRSGSVGRCALLPNGVDGALMTFHLLRIRVDPRVCVPDYLLLALRGSRVVARQIQEAAIGATRAGFNTRLLSDLWIPLAPVAEQVAILRAAEERIHEVAPQRQTAGTLLARLDALDAAMIGKVFRGELVAQDLNDEPASVLLERARVNAPGPSPRTRRSRTRA